MYFHAPCGVVLYSVMVCLYIVECKCNVYEHKKNRQELSSPSPSSIRDHIKQTGHIASIDDFSVVKPVIHTIYSYLRASSFKEIDPPLLPSSPPFLWFYSNFLLFTYCFSASTVLSILLGISI